MENNRNEAFLKKFYFVLCGIYLVTLLYALYHNFTTQDFKSFGMSIVAIFTPLMIPVGFKLLHFKPVYEIYILNIVFMYFASLVGSSYHWYSYKGFDKILHFTSGFFGLMIAILLFFMIRKSNKVETKQERTLFLVFINAVNMSIALLWEFYEYAVLIFLNNDAINHYSQGVHDSMTDMLCATTAGILLTILVFRYLNTGKANFLINVYEKFYIRNIEQK